MSPRRVQWDSGDGDRLFEKIASSNAVISLMPHDGTPDLKIAQEIGATLLLDKPLVVVVAPGARLPSKLAEAADMIVEWANDDDERSDHLQARLRKAVDAAVLRRAADPQTVIGCPRARSSLTPCVARDGDSACLKDATCAGCRQHPAELLAELVPRYVALYEKIITPTGSGDGPREER